MSLTNSAVEENPHVMWVIQSAAAGVESVASIAGRVMAENFILVAVLVSGSLVSCCRYLLEAVQVTKEKLTSPKALLQGKESTGL